MKGYKAEGIVIRVKRLNDVNKLIVLLSKDSGRIELIAKGHGKLKSRKTTVIDLLNNVEFSIYPTNSLDLIIESLLIDDYSKAKSNKYAIRVIVNLSLILDKFTIADEVSVGLYDLAIQLMHKLEYVKSRLDADKLFLAFELMVLENAGIVPSINICTETGTAINADTPRYISRSGIPGYTTKPSINREMSIDNRILKSQLFMLNNGFDEIQKLNLTKYDILQMNRIHKIWLEATLGYELKSLT